MTPTKESEPRGPDMAKSLPGLATPWPHPKRWATVRRLLAAWRWEWERGPTDPATINAYNSVERRGAAIEVDILERGEPFRQLCRELLALGDFT